MATEPRRGVTVGEDLLGPAGGTEHATSAGGLRVFISYRRDDAKGFARALKGELSDRYGKDRIFMDLDNIDPGELWEDVIRKAVSDCDALIALIGKRWLVSRDAQKRRRLDDPQDPVRLEIETALALKLKVIPALIEGARMPMVERLPESLSNLPRIQALAITDDWDAGVTTLIETLDKLAQRKGEGHEPPEREQEPAQRAEPKAQPRAEPRFLDFDLLIEHAGKGYRANVIDSPAGQASADFDLPFSEAELENLMLRLVGSIGRMQR